jgi:hypothetical protein
MRRLLLVLVLIGVVAVGLSFFMGWLLIGSDPADSKPNIKLSVDVDKFQEDRKKVVD